MLLVVLMGCPSPVEPEPAAAVAQEQPAPEGQALAESILAQWKHDHPDRDWVIEEHAAHTIVPPHDNADLVGKGQGASSGLVTEKDVLTWERETTLMVTEGSRIFHSAELLGSTNGVSCDMCHPDGANTHPETYPKYQVQMGSVALLRDMINWCILQPVAGQPLEADDPKMRALEAYIYAQRKGTPLTYGRR
jgi:cytochrome c